MAKRCVAQHTTLLVIGEGADDQAFINHMKGLYCPRGCGRSAKIEAGDGGSPGNIITTAIRAFKGVDYDRRFLVLDSDIPPSAAEVKQARSAGYQIILWSPQCLEGALLEVRGERVGEHETSQGLIPRWQPMRRYFPKRFWMSLPMALWWRCEACCWATSRPLIDVALL